MKGPHGLYDIRFVEPEDAIVAPLRGQLFFKQYPKPELAHIVKVFDHSSQTLAEGMLGTTKEATQAAQWLLDITGARLNCETAPLTQNGSFVYY